MSDDQFRLLTKAEGRQMLDAIKTPQLEKLRESIRTTPTSELIILITAGEVLADQLIPDTDRYTEDDEKLILTVGVTIITNEIDRRIPIPKDG